jgi:putative transcriptional regulator
MSKAGDRLLRSVLKARAYVRGEIKKGFVVHIPKDVNVKALRGRLGLTQQEFAARFGFGYDALRDWEAGRRQPERAARALLTVIDHDPAAVEKALAKHRRAA